MNIGIVAPSAKVPRHELALGLARLRDLGFEPIPHRQVAGAHRFFAGDDAARATAFHSFARRRDLPALWCARGGYGALRLLPRLDALTRRHGKPPRGKLLIGYSDATALHAYVRERWDWETLHAPMPGVRDFCRVDPAELAQAAGLVLAPRESTYEHRLRPAPGSSRLARSVRGPLLGGNLTVWAGLAGTPYAPDPRGAILFFEDVDEPLYRIDRYVQQLALSGGLDGARAIVLGNWLACRDSISRVLKRVPRVTGRALAAHLAAPPDRDLEPLRAALEPAREIPRSFVEVARERKIPVFTGLPSGHGPGHAPLALGAIHSLGPSGRLALETWKWKGVAAARGSR